MASNFMRVFSESLKTPAEVTNEQFDAQETGQ